MVDEPIKLKDNFHLYSGDIITINDSSPLLVEVIDEQNQKIKLRKVRKSKYLAEHEHTEKFFGPLKFTKKFEKVLTFTIRENGYDKINLQANGKHQSRYLESKSAKLSLSTDEKWLTITKQQNTENIANFEEIIIENSVKLHKEKEEKSNEEELAITEQFCKNGGENPSSHTLDFNKQMQKERSFTQSKEFTFGVSANLKLTFASLVGLDIGGKFETKLGNSNTIKTVDNETIQQSWSGICPPWKKLRVELKAKKVKLLTPCTATVSRTIGGRNYKYLISGEYTRDNYFDLCFSSEEITTRNILIVGWTGSGKSTLAKVLSGEDKFEEGDGSTPKTKWGEKSNEFKHEENYYCLIDNIGFGDTEVEEKEELMRIGYAINDSYQGISHVLFVFGERFSNKEKESFRKLAALKFTSPYITLVRSHFENFGNSEECERDEEFLKKESPEIRKLLNNCRGLLHIDNGDEDSRERSQKVVLKHLHGSCPNKPLKPKEWEDISSLIDGYLREKERLENERKQANIDQREMIEQKIGNLTDKTAKRVEEKIKEEGINEILQLAQIVQKEN